MAKKRKTRDQKKLADLRHTFSHTNMRSVSTTSPSFDLKTTTASKIEAKTLTLTRNSYPYLKKDLSKTAFLTMGILLVQALLFAILKNHIFVIPSLIY